MFRKHLGVSKLMGLFKKRHSQSTCHCPEISISEACARKERIPEPPNSGALIEPSNGYIVTTAIIDDSPINRSLPAELLSSIFVYTLYENIGENMHWLSKNSIFTPLILATVCRTWRRLVWSIPELWAHLFIRIDIAPFLVESHLVEHWLMRSSPLPLSIYIHADHADSGRPAEPMDKDHLRLIEIIHRHAMRWKCLHIPSFLLPHFRWDHICKGGVSSLRELVLKDHSHGASRDEVELQLGNLHPGLEKLTITGIRLKSLKMEWNALTHISASYLPFDECLEVLRRVPQLISCQFTNVLSQNPGSAYTPLNHIVHHKLQNFHVEFASENYHFTTSELFSKLTLLSLKELNFDIKMFQERILLEIMIPFLRRSSSNCPLKKMIIRRSSYMKDGKHLVKFLQATPLLQHLILEEPYRGPSSYDYLKPLLTHLAATSDISVNSDTPFLSNLQSIECRFHGDRFPWRDIPGIFGPVSEVGQAHRRPLNNFSFISIRGRLLPSLSQQGYCAVISRVPRERNSHRPLILYLP
ncbi:hypothetical protein B0H34DRAFT_799149 [Crassisporium funariophilum]|nr:hypothetical protein B0H34DRAFT_799149 [Crassisporium funariophilum]